MYKFPGSRGLVHLPSCVLENASNEIHMNFPFLKKKIELLPVYSILGAFRVLQQAQESGLRADCKLYTTLISTCAKCGKVDRMFEVCKSSFNYFD